MRRTVNNIPSINAALIVSDNRGSVVNDDPLKRRVVKVSFGNPSRQLAVPDASVAANELAMLMSEGHDFIATCEVEDPPLGFDSFPFHGITLFHQVSISNLFLAGI